MKNRVNYKTFTEIVQNFASLCTYFDKSSEEDDLELGDILHNYSIIIKELVNLPDDGDYGKYDATDVLYEIEKGGMLSLMGIDYLYNNPYNQNFNDFIELKYDEENEKFVSSSNGK